ncbi:MAG: hypothetical protein ACYTGZ_05570 [Planctomycetota bacterium]|jgi:hypothetical protein
MSYRTLTSRIAVLIAFFAGCSTSTEEVEAVDSGIESSRRITLSAGDEFTITSDESGSTIRVVIAAGKPDAGTYTTSNEVLLPIARDARDALGKRGVTVWIRVDDENRIAVIGWKQVL